MIFQGKEIYIISFSTDRNHFNYTNQIFLTEYSGYLYINKEDFSIVKIIENWKVIDYSDNLKLYYNNFSNKFTFNKLTKTSLESNYKKEKNDKYYLEKSIYEETGEVLENNESLIYKKTLNSFWYNINYEKVNKISFKSESDELKNIKHNKTFWINYQFPSQF